MNCMARNGGYTCGPTSLLSIVEHTCRFARSVDTWQLAQSAARLIDVNVETPTVSVYVYDTTDQSVRHLRTLGASKITFKLKPRFKIVLFFFRSFFFCESVTNRLIASAKSGINFTSTGTH